MAERISASVWERKTSRPFQFPEAGRLVIGEGRQFRGFRVVRRLNPETCSIKQTLAIGDLRLFGSLPQISGPRFFPDGQMAISSETIWTGLPQERAPYASRRGITR